MIFPRMRVVITLATLTTTGVFCAQPLPEGVKSMSSEDLSFYTAIQKLATLTPKERELKLLNLIRMFDTLIADRKLEVGAGEPKLKTLAVFLGGGNQWIPGDEFAQRDLLRLFRSDPRQAKDAERAINCWQLLVSMAPNEAFAQMEKRSRLSDPNPTAHDALHLLASTRRQPGLRFQEPLSKATWSRFHSSLNPCYKFLALEKYDSTVQSPDELLGLYRECLFGSFGYMQVRALEGIYRSKDYRPEVRAMLQEFLKSNPVADDGTLPAYPAIIANPIDGANFVLKDMDSPGAPPASSPGDVVTNGSINDQPPTPATRQFYAIPPVLAPREPKLQSKETANDSVRWPLIAGISIALNALLLLLLKKRK